MFDHAFAALHMCHTCHHAIGSDISDALECTLHQQLTAGIACGEYEREAGADMPDPDDPPAVIYWMRVVPVSKVSRKGKREAGELRSF